MKRYLLIATISLIALCANSQISTGYRGFVDVGYGISLSEITFTNGSTNDISNQIFVSTSHGYQIIPNLFVGAGIGVSYYHQGSSVGLPVYGHVRADFGSRFGFFAEVKGGYTALDISGAFVSPAIGVRFGLNDNFGLNLGVGYLMQKVEYATGAINALNIKLGFDF